MNTLHLVDPELLPLLEQMPEFAFAGDLLPAIRAATSEAFAAEATGEVGVLKTEVLVPAPNPARDVRVLVYQPEASEPAGPAYFHIHGGGFVMGSPEMNDARNREYARKLCCTVVSVDYRLAPEAHYPSALDDCYAALRWLHQQAGALGVNPQRIAIGGESAGGGLAAALALLVRDRAEFPIAFQMLIYPMLDDRTGLAEINRSFTGEFVWNRANNIFGWRSMLGREPGGDDVPMYAAPSRARDLSGLSPAFIAVGALDLFVEENIAYAQNLIRAGVPAELHIYPGAFHGFNLAASATVSTAFERDCQAALATAFSRTQRV